MRKIKIINSDTNEAFLRGIRITKKTVLGFGWSKTRGDWWYNKNPVTAKFFDIRKTGSEKTIRYGLYFGRLAIAIISGKSK